MLRIDISEVQERTTIGELLQQLGVPSSACPADATADLVVECDWPLDVLSIDGFSRIEGVRWTEEDDVVELVVALNSDITSLRCSPEHLVLSDGTWCEVQSLRPHDPVTTLYGEACVVSLANIGARERLCDLQVEAPAMCYYANGVLSHNSHFLTFIGANAVLRGINVLHYTFELSESAVGIRYDSNMCDINSNDVIDNKEAVIEKYKQMKLGRLIIKEFPTNTASIHTIRSHVERLDLKGFRPGLIIIDYADIMRSTRQFDSLRHELKLIYEELRGFSSEKKIPVWTACFHGDTEIATPYGAVKIRDMIKKRGIPVYSYNKECGRIELRTALDVYKSGVDVPVVRVSLSNGSSVIVTHDHKFMMQDEAYVAAYDLRHGDSLMPFVKSNDDTRSVYRNNGTWSNDIELLAEYSELETKSQRHNAQLELFERVTVSSVDECGTADVYNMEVDELHNYALAAGVVVKNSQSNKEGASAEVVDLGNMSEAYGKAMVADFVLTISRRAHEKASGAGRIYIAKNRAGRDGIVYPVRIDTTRSKFEVTGERGSLELASADDERATKRALRQRLDELTAEVSAKEPEKQ